MALKNRQKYLKTCKVAQNFSFFRNFQKKWEKKFLVKNGHFWPFLSFPANFWPFLGKFWGFAKSRQIIPQNEALGESFSKKIFFESKKVNKAQKSRKKGLKRSKFLEKGLKRSNLNLFRKQTTYTSKWTSCRELFKKVSPRVKKGQQSSKIAKKGP